MSTATRITHYRLGYARVSTLQQDESLQRDALQAAGCDRIFVDKASGKLESRPALDALLEQARPGDTVWSGAWTGSAGRCGTSSKPSVNCSAGTWPS